MNYPISFLDYFIYFHVKRDYFECHEVLEEFWKKDPPAKRKDYIVALIQLAVGLYHDRRGNKEGAAIMYKRAEKLIQENEKELTSLAIHVEKLLSLLKNQQLAIKEKKPFSDIDIPIMSNELLHLCKKRCVELLGEKWEIKRSPVSNYIVHKHKERDLEAVKKEREKQLALRERKRKSGWNNK